MSASQARWRASCFEWLIERAIRPRLGTTQRQADHDPASQPRQRFPSPPRCGGERPHRRTIGRQGRPPHLPAARQHAGPLAPDPRRPRGRGRSRRRASSGPSTGEAGRHDPGRGRDAGRRHQSRFGRRPGRPHHADPDRRVPLRHAIGPDLEAGPSGQLVREPGCLGLDLQAPQRRQIPHGRNLQGRRCRGHHRPAGRPGQCVERAVRLQGHPVQGRHPQGRRFDGRVPPRRPLRGFSLCGVVRQL